MMATPSPASESADPILETGARRLTCPRTSERLGPDPTPIRRLLERFRCEYSTGS